MNHWYSGLTKCLSAILVTSALLNGQYAAARDSFRDLQIVYRCEIVIRLETIYGAGDQSSDRDRYLAVEIFGQPQSYVQCLFHDRNTAIYCEAASGYWATKPGEQRTYYQSQETVAALAALGFSTDDAQGNFVIDRELQARPDFNVLADFILRAIHDGYGARASTKLRFNAPFSPGKPTSCVTLG